LNRELCLVVHGLAGMQRVCFVPKAGQVEALCVVYCDLQGDAASAAEALLSTQRESERQVAAAAAAALKTEVRLM
jgi:hypothetical protein